MGAVTGRFADRETRRATSNSMLQTTGWLSLCILGALVGGLAGEKTGNLIIGLAGLCHSTWALWRTAGPVVNAACTYYYASAVFVFFPATYLYFDDPIIHGPADLLLVAAVALIAQVVLAETLWKHNSFEKARRKAGPSYATGPYAVLGTGIASLAILLSYSGMVPLEFTSPAAYSGIVVLSLAVAFSRGPATLGVIAIGVFLFAFERWVFSGFGRLVLASLAVSIAIAFSLRWEDRRVKASLLLFTPLALWYLARSRVELVSELTGSGDTDTTGGLGSVLGPFVRAGELLHLSLSGGLERALISPFFSALTALIPRSWWPNKPVGLGAELGVFFRPEYADMGHSELALHLGEWVWSVGVVGLFLCFVPLAFVVRWLDAAVAGGRARHFFTLAITVVLTASLLDYVWGGSFNFVARVGLRVALLILLLGIALLLRTSRNGGAPLDLPTSSNRHQHDVNRGL